MCDGCNIVGANIEIVKMTSKFTWVLRCFTDKVNQSVVTLFSDSKMMSIVVSLCLCYYVI